MKQSATSSPAVKRLVLVGGGHSHLAVLMQLAMDPVAGLETVLITREVHTPYSGALPGYVSGIYRYDDIHIDLRPLAQFAGVRLIREEVTRLDLPDKRVVLAQRPPLRFDALSLNIGSRPDVAKIPGADQYATGIKPIDHFLDAWERIKQKALGRLQKSEPFSIAIIGGGPASVELAFSVQQAISKAAGVRKANASLLTVKLITADTELLKLHNKRVKDFTRTELERRGVELYFDHLVSEFRENTIVCDGRDPIRADSIIFATGASIPQWPADCGLAVDEQGFIAVNTFLQSISHPFVFACGDAASIEGHPRPKSGVYAVRQGMPLARNLLRFLTGRKLKAYAPQKQALALMYTGDRKAIASRGNWFFKGRWVWALKHKIDTDFLRKYARFPVIEPALQLRHGLTDTQTEQELREHAIRCAGCAAKVGSSTLHSVLATLQPTSHPDLVSSLTTTEDAALIKVDNDRMLVQTVDYFRAFVDDPWLFARIATNHCLSDIYAMGATPHTALAIASVPFASRKIMQETLDQLMAGCVLTLNEHDTALAGGHSNEMLELAFGLAVNGFGAPDRLLGKSGVQAGDDLILCKPLGTGTLLAADMRLKAKNRWMESAFEQMLVSNGDAAEIFQAHGAHACTDITGFGLAGHLLEMLTPDRACARLELDSLPVLEGALDCLNRRIFSSLHTDNSQVREIIDARTGPRKNPLFELLFDPQTAGGLLASVPGKLSNPCLQSLALRGYADARIIGSVTAVGGASAAITVA